MDHLFRDRGSLVAALGAGVVIGISGIYMYYRLNRTMNRELGQLAGTIDDLKREISELRGKGEQPEAATRRRTPGKRSTASTILSACPSQTDSRFVSKQQASQSQASRGAIASSTNGDEHTGALSSATSTEFLTASDVTLVNGVLSDDDDEEFFDFPDADHSANSNVRSNSNGEATRAYLRAAMNGGETEFQLAGGESMASLELLVDINDEGLSLEEHDGRERWFATCDLLLDDATSDKNLLYEQIKRRQHEFAHNADFLWRLAKVTHLAAVVAHSDGNITRKRELAFEAHRYAADGLKADDTNPECYKWYALTVGSLSEFVGTQQKIQNGYDFKKYVDTALRLKPVDPTLHHMLGRWCYEVAQLSWVERKLASTLYSSPPESTLEEARTHLLEADRLKPHWKENMLYIAKTYIGEANYAPAISWIDRAVAVAPKTDGDRVVHKQLLSLQNTYGKHRL